MKIKLLMGALVAALVLSACGNKGDTTTETVTPPPAEAPAPEATAPVDAAPPAETAPAPADGTTPPPAETTPPPAGG